MSKATENELSVLHKRVARSLIKQLDQSETADNLLQEFEGDLPSPVVNFLNDLTQVPPALIQAATKFLKDNDISCDPVQETGMQSLQEKLKKRASVSGISLVVDNK